MKVVSYLIIARAWKEAVCRCTTDSVSFEMLDLCFIYPSFFSFLVSDLYLMFSIAANALVQSKEGCDKTRVLHYHRGANSHYIGSVYYSQNPY